MHLVSQSVFLKTLGWSLFNSLWQMAALWLAYIIITGTGKKFPAKVKYALAVSFLGAGCLLFLISFFNSYFNYPQSPVPGGNVLATFAAGNNFYSIFNAAKQFIYQSLPYCSIGYLFVLIFQLAQYSKYYFHSQQLKLAGLKKVPPGLRIFVDDVARQLGIHKKVNVWLSSIADSPMTVGFLKSVILIPIATINHLSTQQVEAILLHELAHIKRNDYLLNLLITFTGILFFFNPFATLLIKGIRKEAENSCDDLVMQFRYDPHTYIAALLSLEKTRNQQQLAMAAIGENNFVLLERTKRIAGQKNTFQFNGGRVILLFLIVLITCITLWFQPRQITEKLKNKITAAENNASYETEEAFHVSQISSAKNIKPEPSAKIKNNIPEIISDENSIADNSLALVSSEDQDANELQADNNIALAVGNGIERSFSISQDDQTNEPDAKESAGNFPFVPKASFDYQETEDALKNGEHRLSKNEKMVSKAMQNAIVAVNTIDWQKMNNQIADDNQKIDIQKLQVEVSKSLADLDWQKINAETQATTDEADEQKTKENIKLEIKILKNNQLKNPLDVKKLQQKLLKAQVKLQQQNLEMQHEILKNIENEIKKKIKIVYI
jgi:bla regulator protein blaR1